MQKIVVVDRHTSFVGGLDLCFGRYDTSAHQLADFHNYSKHYSIWPGQDYSNPRIQDFIEGILIKSLWFCQNACFIYFLLIEKIFFF